MPMSRDEPVHHRPVNWATPTVFCLIQPTSQAEAEKLRERTARINARAPVYRHPRRHRLGLLFQHQRVYAGRKRRPAQTRVSTAIAG